MTRVSIAGDEDGLCETLVASGHELVTVESEVEVIALREGIVDERRPGGPRVAAIAKRSVVGFSELDRSALETLADAFVIGPRSLAAAIAWVASEDRAARTSGPPRLVVIGSVVADFGASRPLSATPTTLGRSGTFGEHPQRPDAMPTHAGTIARRHAQVRLVDGVVALRDLQSTNGTVIIRRGEPARRLCPMEQRYPERPVDPLRDTAWLVHDSTEQWIALQIGDCIQLPGFWRFRVDGDLAHRSDD